MRPRATSASRKPATSDRAHPQRALDRRSRTWEHARSSRRSVTKPARDRDRVRGRETSMGLPRYAAPVGLAPAAGGIFSLRRSPHRSWADRVGPTPSPGARAGIHAQSAGNTSPRVYTFDVEHVHDLHGTGFLALHRPCAAHLSTRSGRLSPGVSYSRCCVSSLDLIFTFTEGTVSAALMRSGAGRSSLAPARGSRARARPPVART